MIFYNNFVVFILLFHSLRDVVEFLFQLVKKDDYFFVSFETNVFVKATKDQIHLLKFINIAYLDRTNLNVFVC